MYYFNQTQFEAITSARDNSAATHPYADMYDQILISLQSPDDFGSQADGSVQAWFGAAAQANRGIGAASDLIRDYTQAQLEIRTGGSIPNIDSLLQAASNEIADSVYESILAPVTIIDGEQYRSLPSLHTIGQNDALQSLEVLSAYSNNLAVWSGNLLFLGLGDSAFWDSYIIEDDSDSYDLLVCAKAAQIAGVDLFFSGGLGAFTELASLWLSQGSAAYSDAVQVTSQAFSDGNDFLDRAYGGSAGAGMSNLVTRELIVGSEGDDVNLVPDEVLSFNTFLHGGAGHDLIIGSLGSDLLDGGAGVDVVSFEALSAVEQISYVVYMDRLQSEVPYSAYVETFFEYDQVISDVSSVLFDIEELSLGVLDDVLSIVELTSVTTSLDEISAGDDANFGDSIVLADAIQVSIGGGAVVSLEDESISFEYDSKSLSVREFENVIGTSFDDTITGDDGENILVGGDGVDSIDGGAGDDILVVDGQDMDFSTSTYPLGGDGYDVAYTEGSSAIDIEMGVAGIEVVIGGLGDDMVSVFGNGTDVLMAAGGSGDDTFTIGASNPPVVLWGGDGADYFFFNDTAAILAVSVAGLTTENFADFDLDMLGFGPGFQWSKLDAIVINPDGDDRYFIDGEQLGVTQATYHIWDSPGTTFTSDPNGTIYEPEIEIGSVGLTVDQRSYQNYLDALSGNPEFHTGDASAALSAVSEFEASFLGSNISFIQTYADTYVSSDTVEGRRVDATLDITVTHEPENYVDEFTNYYSVIFNSTNDEGWVPYIDEVGPYTERSQTGDWYVAGGHFSGNRLVSNGSVVVAMPDGDSEESIFDWLETISETSGLDIQVDEEAINKIDGFSGTGGSRRFSVDIEGGGNFVQGFDIYNDNLDFEGVDINPESPPEGTLIFQSGLNTVVDFGSGDFVILEGVNLDDWISASRVTIDGTSGNDTIDNFFVDVDGESISGGGQTVLAGDGNDQVYDGSGDDDVQGGAGNDSFYAGNGADTYNGGAGTDQMFYTTASSGLTIDMINSVNSSGIAAGDTFVDIEYLSGSDFDDTIVATAQRVFGLDGDDVITDGAGNQRIYGGNGSDVFRFIDGDGQQDRIADFEIGSDKIDLSLWGVASLSDPDLVIHEPVNGQGNPLGRLEINYNGNSIRLDGFDATDISSLDASHFIFSEPSEPEPEPDEFPGATINGTSGSDTIDDSFVDVDGESISGGGQTVLAGDGNDQVYDGSGDDDVQGGAGNDSFYAGDGADTYNGGAGTDQMFYTTASSGLTIDMINSVNSSGIAAGDTFVDIEYLSGSDFDDTIVATAQRVFGLDGDDVITDGAGNQRIYGGNGSDVFRFIDGDGQQDRIADFEIGSDKIDLSLWGVASLSEPDLVIHEPVNGQGNPLGRLEINYNGNSIRLDGFDATDIASLDASHFVFA